MRTGDLIRNHHAGWHLSPDAACPLCRPRDEDASLVEELCRLTAEGVEAFGRGDYSAAGNRFRVAALMCQAVETGREKAPTA